MVKIDIVGNKTTSILTKNQCLLSETTLVFIKTDVVLLPATSIFTKTDVNIDIQNRFLKTDVVFLY